MGAPPKALSTLMAKAVLSRGVATIDDLQRQFPEYTRDQLQKALTNAKGRGLIGHVKRGVSRGRHGGNEPSVWGAPGPKPQPMPRVASVWELGSPRPASAWPEGVGRKFTPLGGWNEEGTADAAG